MAEEKLSPISAPKPPAVNPLAPAASAHASTLKLKPVIRKPTPGGATLKPKLPTAAAPAAAPAPKPAPAPATPEPPPVQPLEQLKSVTQKLKTVTQQIPQQAILHKTGIIADQSMTDAQKQASKSRTARISLSDVGVGVAPVHNEAAPMTTIRIKRPDGRNKPGAPAKPAAAAPAAATPAEAPKPAEAPSLTQRKTLKVSRPGAGVRPGGAKFSVKKPGAPAPAAPAENAEVAEIADIPDLPAATPAAEAPAAPAAGRIADVPAGLAIFDLLLQVAACGGIFFLGYLLYLDFETVWF